MSVWVAILLAVFAAKAVYAAGEVNFPNLSGEVEFEGQHERMHGSGESGSEDSPPELAAGAELLLQVSDRTQVAMELGLEEVDEGGLDLVGRSFGLPFDSIVLRYEHENFALFGGKFSPKFSMAHDAAPGLYGDDLPDDDIALEDFVGLGGSINLDRTAAGTPTISGSVFRLDRSPLSKPLFSHEERARLADGGPGNTESFRSHALAIDFEEIPGMPGLRYHLGWARLGVEGGNPEHRFASAAQYRFETANRAEISTLGEIVRFLDANGDSDSRRTYVTGSAWVPLQGVERRRRVHEPKDLGWRRRRDHLSITRFRWATNSRTTSPWRPDTKGPARTESSAPRSGPGSRGPSSSDSSRLVRDEPRSFADAVRDAAEKGSRCGPALPVRCTHRSNPPGKPAPIHAGAHTRDSLHPTGRSMHRGASQASARALRHPRRATPSALTWEPCIRRIRTRRSGAGERGCGCR